MAQPEDHGRPLIMASVILSTILQVLDATIANVALPHMQASLGATQESVTWVLTSYILTSAVFTPVAGWLAARIGQRTLYLGGVGGFVFASMLCGAATSLAQIVIFRGLQGAFGAFLMPLGQTVILDTYPREQHGKAMATWGAAVMISPVMGPVLGGWLTENLSWRWVFYVNVPVGLLALTGLWLSLPRRPKQPHNFDIFGFAMLATALVCIQLVLDRGQQLDWFDSWEIWCETALGFAALWVFVIHLGTGRTRLFAPAMLLDPNFATGLTLSFIVGMMTIAGAALLPQMLQHLFGYPVIMAGLLTAPRAVGTLIAIIIVGRLTGKVDVRLMLAFGMLCLTFALYQMTGFSLEMDQTPVVVSGLIQGLGFGFVFVLTNLVAFSTLAPRYRTDGAALYNLVRNIGGSIGISLATVELGRSVQTSHSELAEHFKTSTWYLQGKAFDLSEAAMKFLDGSINRQALMIGYLNDFYLMMLLSIAAMPALLLLRRAKAGSAAAQAHPVMD